MRLLIALLGALLFSQAQAFDVQGSGYIYRAVDGDTYWVSGIDPQVYRQLYSQSRDSDHFNDRYRSVKMRLGAVDTAESVHSNEARNTLRGKTISAHMKRLTEDQQVTSAAGMWVSMDARSALSLRPTSAISACT